MTHHHFFTIYRTPRSRPIVYTCRYPLLCNGSIGRSRIEYDYLTSISIFAAGAVRRTECWETQKPEKCNFNNSIANEGLRRLQPDLGSSQEHCLPPPSSQPSASKTSFLAPSAALDHRSQACSTVCRKMRLLAANVCRILFREVSRKRPEQVQEGKGKNKKKRIQRKFRKSMYDV